MSLCDRTENMVRPWADARYECICVHIQHEGSVREGNITIISADVRFWMPPPRRYRIVSAFPPCTNLAVSGARWFTEKGIGGLMRPVRGRGIVCFEASVLVLFVALWREGSLGVFGGAQAVAFDVMVRARFRL